MGTMHLGVQLYKNMNVLTMQTLVARGVLNWETITITILVRLEETITTLLTNREIIQELFSTIKIADLTDLIIVY